MKKLIPNAAWALLFLALFESTLMADTVEWSGGGGNTQWENPDNWSGGSVPASGDDVSITLDGTYTVTVTTEVSIQSLTLGQSSGAQTLQLGSASFYVQ